MNAIWSQRAEGLVLFILSVWVYTAMGASWWLFALCILAPDIAMLGYLKDKKWGASTYNLAHTYALPLILSVVAYLLNSFLFMALCVIWIAHISMDRALGYGLKLPTDFKDTHLGRIGGRG